MRWFSPLTLLLAFLAVPLLFSPVVQAQEADLTPLQVAVLEADRAWQHAYATSDRPLDSLMANFIDDAQVLAPGVPLARGKEEIRAIFAGLDALPDFSLTWEPSTAEADDELGYTIGSYHMEFARGLGRTEDALARIERTLSLGPDVTLARFQQTGLLLRLGRTAEAAGKLERLAHLEGASDPAALRIVAMSYPGTTPSPEAIAVVRALEREVGPGLYYLPALYDWAGSEADAIRVVEAGVAARNRWLGLAAVFGEYDGLRENPQFKEILVDLGLPNGNTAYRLSRADGAGGSG